MYEHYSLVELGQISKAFRRSWEWDPAHGQPSDAYHTETAREKAVYEAGAKKQRMAGYAREGAKAAKERAFAEGVPKPFVPPAYRPPTGKAPKLGLKRSLKSAGKSALIATKFI